MQVKGILLCLIIVFSMIGCAAASVVTNTENFEHPITSFWSLASSNSGCGISTNYALDGTHSYRFQLNSGDTEVYGNSRSELVASPEQGLTDRFYSFSTYLPSGGSEDYARDNSNSDEIIMQWVRNLDVGEVGYGPTLALHTYTNTSDGTGHYYLMDFFDNASFTSISSDSEAIADGKYHQVDLGSFESDKGKWVNWQFHVKWGYQSSQKPMLEVYKNGIQVANFDGQPNCFNDVISVNQQFGIYKHDFSSMSSLTQRVIYFEDVSVQDLNPVTKLDIPTPYDGMSGQAVHPDIIDSLQNGNVFNGYRYWMLFTPYDYENAVLFENPCLICSNDGINWQNPAGVVNPLSPAPGGTYFQSDTDLIYNGSALYCYFIADTPAVNPKLVIFNGNSLSSVINVTGANQGDSPAVLYDSGTFYYYTPKPSTGKIQLVTSTAGINFSNLTLLNVTSISGKDVWHINAQKSVRGLDLELTYCDHATNGANTSLYIGNSQGYYSNWATQPSPILSATPNTWYDGQVYRSSGLSDSTGIDIYFSADSASKVWGIGKTRVEQINGVWQVVDKSGTLTSSGNENIPVNYGISSVVPLLSSYNPSNLASITATITPIYSKASPYSVPSNPVAWYKFDEGTGSSVSDSSGNGHTGTMHDGYGWTTGKYNSAGYFDGQSGYCSIPSPLLGAGACTVICWVNESQYEQYGSFVSDYSTVDISSFMLGSENPQGTYGFYLSDGVNTSNVQVSGLTTGKLHMLTGEFNGTTGELSIWLDTNKKTGSTTLTHLNLVSSTRARIGGHNAYFFANAAIDNVLIYNRSLTDNEIRSLYYDNLQSLTLQTNSGYSTSDLISGSSQVSIPFSASDSIISGLITNVPNSVVQNGITINDYPNTVTPFSVSTVITEITTPITKAKSNANSDIVGLWGTFISLLSVLVFLVFFYIVYEMLQNRMSFKSGSKFIMFGAIVVLLVVFITYILYILLSASN